MMTDAEKMAKVLMSLINMDSDIKMKVLLIKSMTHLSKRVRNQLITDLFAASSN